MPYTIVEEDGQFCVYVEGEDGEPAGDSLGCHDSADDAGAQIEAIEAEEDKGLRDAGNLLRRASVSLDDLLMKPGALTRILDAIRKVQRVQPGFKALPDGLWVAWWSNNFKDREGEILSAGAHDRYVKRLDAKVVPMPELWFWHVPGTAHGKALWVDRIGHFMVAVGRFDDSELGRRFAAHYAEADAYAVSHGFKARPSDLRDGVWHDYNTFEVSPLPTAAAANPFTLMEVKAMSMTDEKRRLLEEIVGKDMADEIVRHSEARGKALEALGEQYKDVSHAEADAVSAEVAAVDSIKQAVGPLLVDLTADLGEVVESQQKAVERAASTEAEVRDLKAQVRELTQTVKALQAELRLSPKRASQDTSTIVDGAEAGKALPANGKKDGFWG